MVFFPGNLFTDFTRFRFFFVGNVIATQLLDVSIRVQAVRSFAVTEMTSLLESFPVTTQSGTMFEVLYAAAWIVGEFATEENDLERILNILLKSRSLPGHIQGVYIQNIIKLATRILTGYLEKNDSQSIVWVKIEKQFFNLSN